MSDRRHGTYARYQRGPGGPCRCAACKAAATEYQRRYRRSGRDKWTNKKFGTCVRGLGWPRIDGAS